MNLPIMENDGNDVIRYLMNEMDPSQEVLMEHAMMEDDDLLIEVESLRQTLKHLDDLPEKGPSEDLTNSILEQAAEQQKHWYHFPSVPKQAYKYAAMLLLGMGLSSGFWLMQGSSGENNSEGPQTASINATLPVSLQTTSTEKSEVEPWVDHNNVLYFQDRLNTNSTAFKGIIKASMKKVTPLQGPPAFNFKSRNLQMTGSH